MRGFSVSKVPNLPCSCSKLTVSRGWTKGVDIASMRAEENFSKFQPHRKDLRSVWEMRRLKTQWDKNRYDLPRDRSLAIIRMISIHFDGFSWYTDFILPKHSRKIHQNQRLRSCWSRVKIRRHLLQALNVQKATQHWLHWLVWPYDLHLKHSIWSNWPRMDVEPTQIHWPKKTRWWNNGESLENHWQVASCKDHIYTFNIIIYVYTCIQNKPRIQKATCHSALCYHPLAWTHPYLRTTWTITLPLRTLQVTSSCSSCHSTPQVLAKSRSPCGVMASLWGTITGRLLNLGGCLKWSTKWLDKFVCVNARQAMSQFRKPHQLGRLFEGFWLLG